MREILFRGKDIVGNWYAGNLAVIKQDLHNGAGTIKAGSYISNKCGVPFAYQVRPETVGQYTGLKDKNGKMVFEGDIVRRVIIEGWVTEPITGVIVFKNGCFTLEHKWLSKDYIHNDLIIDSKMVDYNPNSKREKEQYSYEVIGNIHDNKMEDIK